MMKPPRIAHEILYMIIIVFIICTIVLLTSKKANANYAIDKLYLYETEIQTATLCNEYCFKFGSKTMQNEWMNPLYKQASGQFDFYKTLSFLQAEPIAASNTKKKFSFCELQCVVES